MKILDTTYHIGKSRKGYYMSNLFGEWEPIPEIENDAINKIYRIMRCTKISDETKKEYIINVCKKYGYLNLQSQLEGRIILAKVEAFDEITPTIEENIISITPEFVSGINNRLINFFSEFEFEPNFRFINTLGRNSKSFSSAKSYVVNYFKLIDNGNANAIMDKMNSQEFKDIVKDLETVNTTKKINNRFKLYYGSQGTGKTTQAMKESEGRCMVCHSAMLPSDLMEDFKFNNGKAEFIPSALQNAMVNGYTITLDEINLLPFESLRFLQSILDGKASFEYKGKTINIKEGFKIIGTMNLQVNGSIYALPEPLVDRAEELKEYKLTADMLIGALI